MKKAVLSTLLIFAFFLTKASNDNPADTSTWHVSPTSFQYSMSVTTCLVFGMEESRDVRDMIAAFVGNECRGVSQPITYVPKDDRYVANLIVRSNIISGEVVHFYMYDCSEDEVIEVVDTIHFSNNATYGNAYDPYFARTTYDVTFNVFAGNQGVSGAVVSLDERGQETTNSEGVAEFISVLPADSIYYSINATGYDFYQDSISLTETSVSEDVYLTLTRKFLIKDEYGDPLPGATVNLTGYGSAVTDAEGKAEFEGITPSTTSISYTIEKAEYNTLSESFIPQAPTNQEEQKVLYLTRYTAGFVVTDGANPIEGATVTLTGYGSGQTNASGLVEFTGVLPAPSISYSVSAPSYDLFTGTISVNNNTLKTVDITLTAYDVTFSIIDGEIPIEGAVVTLEGYNSKTTDVLGEVKYTNVILEDDIVYTVTATGYNGIQGSLSVVDGDVLEKITLSYKTYSATFKVDNGAFSLGDARVSLRIPSREKENFDDAVIPSYFSMTGNASWVIDYQASFFSPYSMKSGTVLSNQSSGFTFIKETEEGEISFFARVSSEEDNDYLIFYIDNEEKIRWSGETGWLQIDYPVSAGEHTFKWEYKKDGTQKAGEDCAWVDFIQFPSGTEYTWKEATSSSSGNAIIPDLKPQNDMYFKVEAEGYDLFEDSISVGNANTQKTARLKLSRAFLVKDENGNPLEGANISLQGYDDKYTSKEGYAEYNGLSYSNSVYFTVELEGYNSYEGLLIVRPEEEDKEVIMELTKYTVEFQVSDTAGPVGNARIYLQGYDTLVTNSAGSVVFTDVIPSESIEYTIDAENYDTYKSTFSLEDEDIVKIIDLNLTAYNVSFSVINGEIPVEGADIMLTGYGTKQTSVLGEVIFNNVIIGDNIEYAITSLEYNNYISRISVVDADVEEKVTLIYRKYDAVFKVDDGVNPVEGAEVSIKIPVEEKENFDDASVPSYFNMIGENTWSIDYQASFFSPYSLKSGPILSNQQSGFTFNKETAEGEISFFANVSSEENNDYLIFYIDNEEKMRWSGETGWQQLRFAVEAGEHSFSWIYMKDGTQSAGEDCAWIDYIVFPSGTVFTWVNAETSSAGNALIPDIKPQSDMYYKVETEEYDLVEDSLSITNANSQKLIHLTLSSQILIMDETGDPLKNATVGLEGYGEKLTNTEGIAEFNGVVPKDGIPLYVEMDEYNRYDDTLIARPGQQNMEINLELTRYNVEFHISDTSGIVENARVYLAGYDTLSVNVEGIVIFTDVVPAESIEYTVIAESYDIYQSTLSLVNEDVVKEVDLTLTAFDVRFSIINGEIPVYNASVLLEGYGTLYTNIFGEAVFHNVILQEKIPYLVSTDEYKDFIRTVSVVNGDIEEKVTLSYKVWDVALKVTDGSSPVEGANVSIKYPGAVQDIDIITPEVPDMFTTDGNNVWYADDEAMFQGEYALKSGEIFDNQRSELSFTKYVVTGDFSFHSKVSSEADHDYLRFYIDGVEMDKWSGESDWLVNNYKVTTGEHTFKWVFSKDGTKTTGADCAWLDFIQYPAGEMITAELITDENGNVLFEDLLPHYDSLEVRIEDSRYNPVVDSISISDHNVSGSYGLDIDLVFKVSKEFNREFGAGDSVCLEGYGKKALDTKGMAVYRNVIPTANLDYSIHCEEYNTDSGTIVALYNDTISRDLDITRYTVGFLLTYQGNPLSDLSVVLGNYGPLTTSDEGTVNFMQLIPGIYDFTVEHMDYQTTTGTIQTPEADTLVELEILPVFNVHIVVHSGAHSGYIPIENAKVELSQDNRVLYTTDGQVTFYRLIPDNNLIYTVEAEGYETLSGALKLSDSDLHETMALPLIPVFEAANLITPNNDGRNDYWEIYNVERYKEFNVKIFSSTGELLYETTDYEHNKWDGRINGNKIPDGIYYYIVKGPTSELLFKGVINLVNN